MMTKTTISLIIAGCLAFAGASKAMADPMDLSGFSVWESVQGSVVESGGVIGFAENTQDAILYFYNDTFLVDPLATTLAFAYELTLGVDDYGDYLQFNVNSAEQFFADTAGSGNFIFDLMPYRGTTVSIDWALGWNGDGFSGSTATVYNVDIVKEAAPVPEPTTIMLLGVGLAGLAAVGRKRNKQTRF